MDNDILRRLGKRISELRRDRGFSSQEAFAHYLNTQRAFVGHLETGRKDFRLSTLIRIADALNMPLSELFLGVDGREARKAQSPVRSGIDQDALIKGVDGLEKSLRHLRALVAAGASSPKKVASKPKPKR